MGNDIAIHSCDSIEQLNEYLGIETLHPMVSIIKLSDIKHKRIHCTTCTVYIVALCLRNNTITTSTNSEYSGDVHFRAPGHKGCNKEDFNDSLDGWLLTFSGNLMTNTLLANRLSSYPFFSNTNNPPLQLTERETRIVLSSMQSIHEELSTPTDKYSNRILAAGIAVLLNICQRYYERQGHRAVNIGHNISMRLDILLSNHLWSPATGEKQMPTVASCAHALQLSPNYLGDLIRKETGISAHSYIQRYIVSEIKHQLTHSDCSITEIDYKFGMKYPHHLTRMFKRETGLTPQQFRASIEETEKTNND